MKTEKLFTFKIFKLTQTTWEIYMSKINAHQLYNMSKADIMKISEVGDDYDGIQRVLNSARVEEIKDYLDSNDATFPNSIILNIDEKYVKELTDTEMSVHMTPNTFSIIDGQHRLAGFENDVNTNFELNVSIFLNLTINQQRRIFKTINTEHTKINNSQSFYSEIDDEYDTPRKFAANLSKIFAIDITSPWYKKIKLLGIKDDLSPDGIIALDTFAKPIIASIYNDKSFYKLRNFLMENNNDLNLLDNSGINIKKSFLWEYYVKQDEDTMYKIFFNYFSAIKRVFKNDWNNPNSFLTKTTGYNAFMMLFKDLVQIGLTSGTLSEEFFYSKLSVLTNMDGTLNSNNYPASGTQSTTKFYNIIKDKVINLFTV